MEIKYIDSKSNKLFKYLKNFKKKKYRYEARCFMIEGIVVLKEALSYSTPLYTVTTEAMLDQVRAVIDGTILVVSEALLNELSDTQSPQGVIAYFPFVHTSELPSSGRFILLDDIQDPGNAGGLIRSADGFNMGVIMTPACVDIYNPKTVRSTMASIFRTPLIILKSKRELAALKGRFDIVVTDVVDAESSVDFPFKKDTVVVLGNEAGGVSDDIKAYADATVRIPTEGIDSLNVNVAGSILMYEMQR
ncbi:RNA methyltransferase [Peptoniphilus equinus]|uniref:RNA methyltransferase n=1 Tax=Peptoniphilus equinus TaxID=3016343 RepID=A0ABY7QSF1_9FIRM|nr:RNA methyltransferase [Peptoniphilus equinus]WBW49230.1 RNA methyltransferase [Peptoniphilus equinus]